MFMQDNNYLIEFLQDAVPMLRQRVRRWRSVGTRCFSGLRLTWHIPWGAGRTRRQWQTYIPACNPWWLGISLRYTGGPVQPRPRHT